ncbi:unnamed protein product, partial [Mycena citricolor]
FDSKCLGIHSAASRSLKLHAPGVSDRSFETPVSSLVAHKELQNAGPTGSSFNQRTRMGHRTQFPLLITGIQSSSKGSMSHFSSPFIGNFPDMILKLLLHVAH